MLWKCRGAYPVVRRPLAMAFTERSTRAGVRRIPRATFAARQAGAGRSGGDAAHGGLRRGAGACSAWRAGVPRRGPGRCRRACGVFCRTPPSLGQRNASRSSSSGTERGVVGHDAEIGAREVRLHVREHRSRARGAPRRFARIVANTSGFARSRGSRGRSPRHTSRAGNSGTGSN